MGAATAGFVAGAAFELFTVGAACGLFAAGALAGCAIVGEMLEIVMLHLELQFHERCYFAT